MQLTSIEQCREDQIVWHPVWGGGRIKQVNMYSISVEFIDSGGWVLFYTKDWENDITHLHTERVYICSRTLEGEKYINGTTYADRIIYKPVNPEQ